MNKSHTHIHSVERAKALESSFRYRFQNPEKLLRNYIRPGMTVLDLGCGPGFFTTEIARLLNKSGKVIGADIQNGMLEMLRQKINGTEFEHIVQIHKCKAERLDINEKIDFILAFYAFHEMSCLDNIINEIKLLLKPGGEVFIAEQKFHVSKSTFIEIINKMEEKGFVMVKQPSVFLSRAVVMKLQEK